MVRSYFAKKTLVRKCHICKGPNPYRAVNDHIYCELCLSKRCCVCRKIKLEQVQLVNIEGIDRPICPRHFGAFTRYQGRNGTKPNLKWLADEELNNYIEKLKLDKLQQENAAKQANGLSIETIQTGPDFDDLVDRLFSGKLDSKE